MLLQIALHIISIHAPRTGSDAQNLYPAVDAVTFQSTLPARGATAQHCALNVQRRDFNPRSPHGERRFDQKRCVRRVIFQSTLPARGATHWKKSARNLQNHFNPRSPHGERQFARKMQHIARKFQSTLPARGATNLDFLRPGWYDISIHAPRTGSDPTLAVFLETIGTFQSTLPARGATRAVRTWGCAGGISIHAPRTGSDYIGYRCVLLSANFNPRSPHGERLHQTADNIGSS